MMFLYSNRKVTKTEVDGHMSAQKTDIGTRELAIVVAGLLCNVFWRIVEDLWNLN